MSASIRDILRMRLCAQHISKAGGLSPHEVVSQLGAVQAQDFAGSKWSMGLRTGLTEPDIDAAIESRTIIRTWPMRGTLHFVAAPDARWMLSLLTPRIISGMAGRNRQLELDEKVFSKSRSVLETAMEDGRQLTRNEVYAILQNNGIHTSDQRGIHIINYLAQTQVLCHGAHQQKQATYVLMASWLPDYSHFSEEEALAKITLRYFTGHGPATLADFIWWTGLKISDSKKGIASVAAQLSSTEVDGQTYWFEPGLADVTLVKTVHLLPGFDEYMLGYTQRTLMVSPQHLSKIVPGNNGMFMPTIVVDGQVKGLWSRTIKRDHVMIKLSPFENLTKGDLEQIGVAARKYGKYLGTKAVIQ
jgi:hypothetical protein